jgi:hypothetical protein
VGSYRWSLSVVRKDGKVILENKFKVLSRFRGSYLKVEVR